MPGAYELRLETTQLKVLIARTRTPGSGRNAAVLGQGIRKAGAVVQARAVRNVTGYPVLFDGSIFRVKVVTGTLRGSIELDWPYGGTVFQARVYVNGAHMAPATASGGRTIRAQPVAKYAGAIEWGHPEIDLKKHMQGKVVPFFGAMAQKARGPYAARGLKPIQDDSTGLKSRWRSATLDQKLAAKGKDPMEFEKRGGAHRKSSYFITFRRVGKQGWIIPAARPRPFMRAALFGTLDQTRRIVVKAAVEMLDPRNP